MEKELMGSIDGRGGAFNAKTQVAKAGNTIFVGGQMSLDENGNVVGSNITEQAENVFEIIKQILAHAGAGMTDVVKHNVFFHCDGDDVEVAKFMEDLNQVRLRYFSDPGPTTTETRVGLDREGALILVDAWAVVDTERERLTPPGHWNWRTPLPFSHGWKVGEMIFVGGQRSLDANGQLIGARDIEVQTANSFHNLEAILQEGGGDRNNLMRQNTFFRFYGQGREVTEYWERMDAVRRQYVSVPSAVGAGIRISGFPAASDYSSSEELIQVEGIGVLGQEKKRLMPDNHWDWSVANNTYTQGWRIGDLVFVGGQISADSHAKAVGEGMECQARNVFQFVRNTLAEAGLDESDVVKLYIYFYADDDWAHIAETSATIQKVQREFYPEPGPTSTAIRATGFAYEGLLIEIEALAIARD